MSATIIVEDGSGTNPAANSYLDLPTAQAYFDTILDHTNWDTASTDTQTRLILTCTQLVDNCVEWFGFKANILQPLQWPRVLARDPNQYGGAYYRRPDTYLAQYWDSTTIPKPLVRAVCEQARFMLSSQVQGQDRSGDAPGKGLSEFSIYQGVAMKFDKSDQQPIIPDSVQFLIQQMGSPKSARSGNARVSRT